jgi:hypothetical protein
VFWVLRVRAGTGPGDGPAPAWWTFAVSGGLVVASTLAATAARLTIVGYDSWAHYQASAIYLADHGLPSAVTLGQYGPLIPAVIAAGRMFGGDWIYAVYPVMAVDLLLLTVRSVYRVAAPRTPHGVALALAGVTGIVLLFTRSFITHSLYVHSQMYSALFLTLAVVPLLLAVGDERHAREPGPDSGPSGDRLLPVLLVSGLATAGLALTRPDGLVYVFVPMLLVVALRLERGWPARRLLYYAAPLLAVLAASYVPAYVRLGAWQSGKLSGKIAFVSLALILAGPVVGEWLARWDRSAWLRRGHNALRFALALDALAVAAAAAIAPKNFSMSVSNMLTNLLSTGGYGRLWIFIAGVVLVTVVLGVLRCGDGPVYTLFALAQFFAIALVVHGLAHPGRLSAADSFNRVAFHVVPIALWYAASAVATFWPSDTPGDDVA